MPQKLLIVDDSQSLHDLIKAQLGDQDYIFESAYTGAAALEAAPVLLPDAILLDVDLPDMNGFDVCRFLKAHPVTSQIPVIFLTASGSTDEVLCGLELQAADYVTKPFNHEELAYRVRGALRTRRMVNMLTAAKVGSEFTPFRSPGRTAKLARSHEQPAGHETHSKFVPPAVIASG
jgi:DNA-binding response OmpR family regulator